LRWYRAVALDLDGTLTTGGWPVTAVLDGIAALRADGVRVLLVTGRILADLDVEFPNLADRFDVVVAENGCVLRTADWTRPLADPLEPTLLDRLHDSGIGVRRGQVLLATHASADHVALDAIESLGLDVHLVRNRAALMLMPAGITKGTGLREGLAELDISPHNTARPAGRSPGTGKRCERSPYAHRTRASCCPKAGDRPPSAAGPQPRVSSSSRRPRTP